MGFINKIKDFFYDEELVDEEVPAEEPKKRSKTVEENQRRINIYDIEKEKNKSTLSEKKKNKVEQQEIPERDLFRAERTFNFPMNMDDELDFEPVKKEPERHVEEKNIFPKTTKTRRSTHNYSTPINRYNSTPKKEEKHFKPSPIVSPIYGILDQDYKKEDLEVDTRTKEFSFDKKIDFDTVRKKAYASLDDELEKTFNDEKKDIFFNLNKDEEKEKEETKKDLKEEYEEEPYKKDEVVITYDEVDASEREEELEVPKISRSKRHKKTVAEEAINDEENQDLFKIIDDMYKDTDEEGDEE